MIDITFTTPQEDGPQGLFFDSIGDKYILLIEIDRWSPLVMYVPDVYGTDPGTAWTAGGVFNT